MCGSGPAGFQLPSVDAAAENKQTLFSLRSAQAVGSHVGFISTGFILETPEELLEIFCCKTGKISDKPAVSRSGVIRFFTHIFRII